MFLLVFFFCFSTAQQVEQIVRDEGAVPATVAVFNRKLHVGERQKYPKTKHFQQSTLLSLSLYRYISSTLSTFVSQFYSARDIFLYLCDLSKPT